MESDRIRDAPPNYPVWDGHNDLPWAAREQVGYDLEKFPLHSGVATTQTDLPRLRKGGVGAQFWSVYVPTSFTGAAAVVATLEQIDFVHAMTRRYADQLTLAHTAAEVRAARARGRIASLLGAEGGHSIDGSLGVLRMFHALGVRYLTLTHNDNLPWADSATDEPVVGGLSDFGREVVGEMNRIGMAVDLSHVSADTMRDALATSGAPVMFSHSSARAVCDHPRNLPDDVLGSLTDNDGVCMVTFVATFVTQAVRDWALARAEAAAAQSISSDDDPAYQRFVDDWTARHPRPPSTLDDVVAHVEHVREVAGVDHVGIGGDYDGAMGFAPELADVSGYPNLLRALADRGWSDSDLSKLTWGNAARVFEAVEEIATA